MSIVSSTLEYYGACDESRRWASKYDSGREAWQNCNNLGWMRWLISRIVPPHETIIHMANRVIALTTSFMIPAQRAILAGAVVDKFSINQYLSENTPNLTVLKSRCCAIDGAFYWWLACNQSTTKAMAIVRFDNLCVKVLDAHHFLLQHAYHGLCKLLCNIIRDEIPWEQLRSSMPDNIRLEN